MTAEPRLLNPDGKLLPDIERQLILARKTKPLRAKLLQHAQSVNTLEGTLSAGPGDYLCLGIHGEVWPQKSAKLYEKYVPSGEVDAEGWERFDPIPESVRVEAVEVQQPFRVMAHWGELAGKVGDYVIRSISDPTDIWIVDKAIFEASYELQPHLNVRMSSE